MSLDVARDVRLPVGAPSAIPERLADNGAGSDKAPAPAEVRRLPRPATLPTQAGPMGLRFDFNDGCRVLLPETGRPWRVRLSDLDTGNVVYEIELRSGHVNSAKRYFVRFRLEVWASDERILCHDYCAADRNVLVQFPIGTIGDPIGWLPYAIKFRDLHGCRLTCALGDALIPLFRDAYPDVTFVSHHGISPESYYATYSVALFFDDVALVHQPCDFRQVGLHRTAGYILGVDPAEHPPRIALADDTPPIPDPYVCIAVQSTTQCKYWNNPHGWRSVVAHLKAAGYRVICIDQKKVHGRGQVWTESPDGAEDETGDRPLPERARWLKHAAAFVGLSSGLSWLAWAVGTPVVMISGFTHPSNEFTTPYRVINYHACNSCWNDVRHRFDHRDFLWCPRHQGTPRQFECTRQITAEQVVAALMRIPGFRQGGASPDSDPQPALQAVTSVAGDNTICADDALAMRTPRDHIESGTPPGGMAIGITVRAGQMRDQAAAHVADGDRCTQRGDLAAALRRYDRAATLMQRLCAADPIEPAFSRDLSVAQNRIAAVLFAQGHWREAADCYRRSAAIMERLTAANPHNGDFQNDLAWCRARLAEIRAAGDGGNEFRGERTAS